MSNTIVFIVIMSLMTSQWHFEIGVLYCSSFVSFQESLLSLFMLKILFQCITTFDSRLDGCLTNYIIPKSSSLSSSSAAAAASSSFASSFALQFCLSVCLFVCPRRDNCRTLWAIITKFGPLMHLGPTQNPIVFIGQRSNN